MKTLYVSDLDGTLLRSDERTSDYTNQVINRMTAEGMLFSYATARSWITARKVTKGLDAKIPLIVYNGAFIVDNVSGKILHANYFDDPSVKELLSELFDRHIYPIVYAYIGGEEKFSYVPQLNTSGMQKFTDSRKGDVRENKVSSVEDLKKGDIFYITCIDEPEKLYPLYERYRDRFHCVYQIDIYTGDQWLEIMPREASKANAVQQLKEMFQCTRVVAFGDGKNDIDMFAIADECYAVSNAHESLKEIATEIIGSNNEDGVAKWLDKGNHMTDFTTITACGECCTGCSKKVEGSCPGCIEADGRVPEWAESGRCKVHACAREHCVQFCGLCKEFPCEKLPKIISWNANIIEHLTTLRDEYKQK